MKKLLILGGSAKSLTLIKYASKQGYYTILCDYLNDNPGQQYVDEYHCISNTDFDAVMRLSKEKNIDGIVSYSSDLIALTSAYVGNALGLPSNPYDAILILARKDLFRKFLSENGFNTPLAKSYESIGEAKKGLLDFSTPFMIKPVDSAGSIGVKKIENLSEFEEAFNYAMDVSRVKKVILEDYVQRDHECMIAGDVFVLDGKLRYAGLLNSHRGVPEHPFVPTGTSYPTFLNENQQSEVLDTVQRVIDLLGIKFGGLNLELMYDSDRRLQILEIAPRNGGNLIPELLNIATGVNLIEALVEASVGRLDLDLEPKNCVDYCATYVIHSKENGIFKGVEYKDIIKDNIIDVVMEVEPGEEVFEFNDAKKSLGILFLKFASWEEEQLKLKNMQNYIDIVLE